MADNENNGGQTGVNGLLNHVKQHKVDAALWVTRVLSVLFTLGYFLPLFWNPYNLYYKALMTNAATSSLRLHQRLPQVSLSRQFLQELLMEDSCHYLIYTMIFLYMSPLSLVLLPIFLFAVLHSSSYSLTLLDAIGPNALWGFRMLISLVEFQSRNILRLVSFTEIFLMPFTVFIIFLGRGNLLTPFLYYQFLCLRYASRRNPYTRNMFHELRTVTEGIANKPAVPDAVKRLLLGGVALVCRLSPPIAAAEQ